jgi:MFS family permease
MYIISSGLSCVCCAVIGFVHSLPAAIVMRIIAGLVSAVPGTIVGGSIEDIFNAQARIWVVFFWTVASNIGLIIGPIMSSHIIEALNWYVQFFQDSDSRIPVLIKRIGDGSSLYMPSSSASSLVFFSLFANLDAPFC